MSHGTQDDFPSNAKFSQMSGEWENFYVIVGSAAGALIGLQFVVVTLIAQIPALRVGAAGAAFSTPSVVHFVFVLMLSAFLSLPWQDIGFGATVWALAGVGGVIYLCDVARHMRRQSAYTPVLSDWMHNIALPTLAYMALVVSAFIAQSHTRTAMFVNSAAMLMLLFAGIHNTWDAITYHVFQQRNEKQEGNHPKTRAG